MADKKKPTALQIASPYGTDFGVRNPAPPQREWASPDRIEADAAVRRDKLLKVKGVPVHATDETMPDIAGPPVALMQQYGAWLPMQAVNKKVDQITKAHTDATGVPPSPALVRDLLVNDPHITKAAVSYRDMFSRSNTPIKAWRSTEFKSLMQYAKEVSEQPFQHEVGFPGVKEEDWGIPGLYNTHAPEGSPAYKQVEAHNAWVVATSKTTQPGMAGMMGGDLAAFNPIELVIAAKAQNWVGSKLVGALGGTPAGRPFKDAVNGFNQVRDSLLNLPQGLILSAHAVGMDIYDMPPVIDLVTGQASPRDFVPKRSANLAEQSFHQVVKDFRDPEANLGYLTMDVFGILSFGYGTAARTLATAGRIGEAGAIARAGDIGRIPLGQSALYRAADAPLVGEGDLAGHQYFHTFEEAQQASTSGQVHRFLLPSDQVTAYTNLHASPGPDLFPVGETGEVAGGPIAGHTRVYRGQGVISTGESNLPEWMKDSQGRWFTTDHATAARYAKERDGQIHFVDVPDEALKQFQVEGGAGAPEFLLPKETAAAAKPVADLPKPPMIFPAAVETELVTPPGRLGSAAFVAGQAAKTMLSRPVGGSGTYGFETADGLGGTQVVVPYFDNGLARAVQKGYLKLSQKNLRARQVDGQYIFGDTFLDNLFAPERKFKSLVDRQVEAEQATMLAPGLALQRMQSWDSKGKQILRDIFTQPKLLPSILALTSKERIGIETAIKMLGTDSPDAIVDWMNFHQFKIDSYEAAIDDIEASRATSKKTPAQLNRNVNLNKYYVAGHKQKLDAIAQAVKVLDEQNPRLMEIYDQAVRVAKIRNDFQRITLGLDDRTMDQSVASVRHHIQGITTGFTRQEGKIVAPRGVEAWDEAEAAFEQAKLNHEQARQKLLDERAKSLTKAVTPARTAKEARLQQGVDVALEQVDEAQAALKALGDRPENIPLTRVILGEQEQAQRAIEALRKAMKVQPNADIQKAITFLEQGELPSNVAAYLGHLRDRWDTGALTWDDPAYGVIDPINEAIDHLDGVPIEKLLYGEMRSDRSAGGQLRNEFRSVEAQILRAEAEGRFPEDMPELWARWLGINERLGLDHTKRGSLLPEEPTQLKAFMDRAGAEMVKSEPEARAMIRAAEEDIQSQHHAAIDPGETSQLILDSIREAEQKVMEAEARVREHQGPPSFEGPALTSQGQPVIPGTNDWELWAHDQGYSLEEIDAMRTYISAHEGIGLHPWLDNQFMPGEFTGELVGHNALSDEQLTRAIRNAYPEERHDWGGLPMDVALSYESLRIQEAEAFLRGDLDGAQRARAEQIAIDQQWYEGNADMPHTTSISDEDLTQAARDATVPQDVQRATTNLETMRRRTGSFHIPQRREIYRDDTPMGRMRQRLTPYGFKPPREPDSHRHRTGAAIEYGDDRYDTSNLLLEQWGDVARIGKAMEVYKSLWRSHDEGGPAWDSNERPDFVRTARHRPIRDVQDAPESLKQAVAALNRLDQISAKDLRKARDTIEDFAKWFYPEESEVTDIVAQGGKVRWVDERFITEKTMGMDVNTWRSIDQGLGNLLSLPNEAWRLALLFSSPAYALNAVGSSMLLLTKQGFLAPVNYGRALRSRHIYGEEVTRILDALAGNTHTMSYLPGTEKNLFTAMSSLTTNFWQHITDTHFRRAAVIHELRRRGLLKDDLSPTEMADQLNSSDAEIKRLVTEARQAGRNGMLNFDRMSWPERAIARHLFFIYSFMRASAAYTLHYLFEHPAQHAALNAVGRDRENLIKEMIGDNLPQWFYDQGWIPIGPGEVINPNQLNMAGTINQLANPLYGMFNHTPYGNATGFLQGGPTLIMESITGRSLDTGQPFDQGSIPGSFLDMWGKTPLGRAVTRQGQQDEPQVAPPMSVHASASNPIEAAMASERAAINMPTTEIQGWWDTWGRFLGRSAVPIHPNVAALQARKWRNERDQNPALYHQHELAQVQAMVDAQEKVVGRSAPSEVRAAVTFVASYVQHMNDWREGKVGGQQPPKDPNARQNAAETLRWMHKEKLMSNEDFRVRMANVRNHKLSTSEVKNEMMGALWDMGGKPWKDWNDQVRKVDYFAQEDYPVVLQRLKQDGVGDYISSAKASTEDAREYGRKALKFSTRWSQMRTQAASLTGDAQKVAMDQIRVFEDANSNPVKIGDTTFPPLTLAADENSYGRLTEHERRDWLVARNLRSWGNLSAYEKQVLTGEKPDKNAAYGWRTLHQWIAADRAQLQPGKKLKPGLTKYYAESLAKQIPAFKKDWEKSQQPLAQRMEDFNTIKNSHWSEEWSTLLGTAAEYANSSYEQGWKPGPLGDMWKRDNLPAVQAWIARQETGFRAEVQTYIDANPNFLTRLVKN